MNRLVSIVFSLCVFGLFAPCVWADEFYSNQSLQVGPDFNSGFAFGWANGQNAVMTSMSSSLSYKLDASTYAFKLSTNITISGYFTDDPAENNPYLDQMQYFGLNSHNEINLTTVTYNGQWYEFDNTVSLYLNGNANIYRDDEHTILNGLMYSSATSNAGAIPIGASSSVQIFAPGHPTWLPDWQVDLSSEWLVTSPFHAVPASGSLAILGVAGLIGRRRRYH